MNILVDDLPEAVEIEGQEVGINTDFRGCLRVVLAFEDPLLVDVEKQAILLENLYPELPCNIQQAFSQGVKFLNGGDDVQKEEKETAGEMRLYSFTQDANLIFAAFRQTHGTDLQSIEHLHWWKFLALFMDLGENTTFCNLVAFRKRVFSGKASKEEMAAYRQMRRVVDLVEENVLTPDEEEKEAEFMRLVREGEKRREQARLRP